jgi:peptidylprolyl isomerase
MHGKSMSVGRLLGGIVLCAAMLLMQPASARTAAEVLADAKPAEWRLIDPANTLYMDLDAGRVIIELAPQFAPRHTANILALVRERYFDGQRINRSQDNFVVQWGDPDLARPTKKAARKVPAEFTRSTKGLPFVALPDPDTYAPQTGFSDGFPAARDPATNTAWPVHCYSMLGVGRDVAADSGDDKELYVVTGHSPRQLDRNITLAGRVVQGMEFLSTLPRGPAPLGVYAKPEEGTIIKRVRVAADLPESERVALEALRTSSQSFSALIEARRNRRDAWYKVPAGRIDVCNVLLPVRERAARR